MGKGRGAFICIATLASAQAFLGVPNVWCSTPQSARCMELSSCLSPLGRVQARGIFATHAVRTQDGTEIKRKKRVRAAGPTPTELLAPDDHTQTHMTTSTTIPSEAVPWIPWVGLAVVAALSVALLLAPAAGPQPTEQMSIDLHWMVPPGYSFRRSLVAGGMAGLSRGLSRILTFPLDTIKTRQQGVVKRRRTGVDDKVSRVNMSKLFDGILPMLLIAGPANAAFFVAYDYLLATFAATNYPHTEVARDLTAALLASLPANIVRIPAEVTKQRVQVGVEKTAFTAALTILNTEGVSGLYVGGLAHLMRELPFNAAQFVTFQNLKNLLVNHGHVLNAGSEALAGALAAGVASLLTQPIDVVKTVQMVGKDTALKSGERQKDGLLDTLRYIYTEYGLGALYLGWLPRLLLCAIGGSAFFMAFATFAETSSQ